MIPPEQPTSGFDAIINALAGMLSQQQRGSGPEYQAPSYPAHPFGAQLEGGFTPYGTSPFLAAQPQRQTARPMFRDYVPAQHMTPAQVQAEARQRAAFIAAITAWAQRTIPQRPSIDPGWGRTTDWQFPGRPPYHIGGRF